MGQILVLLWHVEHVFWQAFPSFITYGNNNENTKPIERIGSCGHVYFWAYHMY